MEKSPDIVDGMGNALAVGDTVVWYKQAEGGAVWAEGVVTAIGGPGGPVPTGDGKMWDYAIVLPRKFHTTYKMSMRPRSMSTLSVIKR